MASIFVSISNVIYIYIVIEYRVFNCHMLQIMYVCLIIYIYTYIHIYIYIYIAHDNYQASRP